jgi:hypothetical protein
LKSPIQNHIIEKQNIILNIQGNISDSDLKTLQQETAYLYKTRIGEMLDKIFSKLVPADVHIKIDNLQIKLPNIEIVNFKNVAEYKKAFEEEFQIIAENIIREKILKDSGTKLERNRKGFKVSKWNILENFLENGHYPSWASSQNDSIDKIFEELIQESPIKVAKLITELSRSNRSKIIDRIVFQFRGKYTDRLLSILFQKNGRDAIKLIESIRRRIGQRYQAMRGQKSVNKAIMTAAFEYVLEKTSGAKKLKYSEKELSQYILEAIQLKYRHVEESDINDDFSAVKNEFKTAHGDLDVMEYFLNYGSLPFWASTESKESVHDLFNRLTQKKLVAFQRMIEKHRKEDWFIKRLLMQFSNEQIFMLMEPLNIDNSRFLKDLLRELERSDFSVLVAKEVILDFFLQQSGKMPKYEISKVVFERTAEKKGLVLQDFLTEFYVGLQERHSISYDLGRSELIRIIAELHPNVETEVPSILQKRRSLLQNEKGLNEKIASLSKTLRDSNIDTELRKQLQKERKNLQNELQQLRAAMQKLGISESDNFAELSAQKIELEKQLSALLPGTGEAASFQKEIDEIKAEIVILQKKLLDPRTKTTDKEELQKRIIILEEKVLRLGLERDRAIAELEKAANVRKEINEIKAEIGKIQKKLIASIVKTTDQEQRQKLISALEKRLLLLGRDRDRAEAAVAELGDAIEKNKDKKSLAVLEKRQVELKKELNGIDRDFDAVKKITDNYKSLENNNVELEASENSKLDFLIFFLQYGSIPWWADEYRESSVEGIFKEFAEKDAEKLRQAFQRVGRNPVVWQRLLNQLEESVLEKVLLILFPNFAGFAISTAILLQKIFEAKILNALEGVSPKYFKWSRVTETLFTMTSSLNPQNFVRTVVTEISREYNISPTTLLEYIANLSDNNQGTRLSIFADIVLPIKSEAEILELEKDLLEMAFKKRLEDDGLAIPEAKKFGVLSDYLLKGIYQDLTYKSGYSSPEKMGSLMMELMIKQSSAIEKLLEDALKNTASRRRISQDLPDDLFWEIVLITAPATMPLVKKYIRDLGIALSDERMSVAKEALLKYIHQLSDKPFIIRAFVDILLKDAEQITQRTRIALINEWKRKVYQAPSYSSTLIIALMQAEMKELKNQADASEDQSEKEQLKDQIFTLQMEYQQMSQRLAYLLNRELPQVEGDFEIPENAEEFYLKIDETEKEIEKLKSSMLENPKGEELLLQIMNQKQLALLEGQLEILTTREPLGIRQLGLESGSIAREIFEIEQKLLALPDLKIPKLPAAAVPDDLEKLASDIDEAYHKLKEQLKKLPEEERAEWIEIAADMGWEDLLKTWSYEQEDALLKELPGLSLSELSERWNALEDKNSIVSKRITGRIKLLIVKTLQELRREQKNLTDEIENAETVEKSEEHKSALLQKELAQNDLINVYFSVALDNNLRQSLIRIRNNIRQNFQRLRALSDAKKAKIESAEKEKLKQKITTLKARRENLEIQKKDRIEQLKSGDKKKESNKVKPEKENKKKKPEKPVDEPLFIRNAGLVILHPYYGRLFSTLNLTEKNKFVSEDAQIRAVHLLQFIATGKTEHPENDLVLNKILCGLPLSTPVPTDVGLTEEELKMASGLLSGAIANWTKMKTMSPDSLRGTFLLREGTIKEEADRWKLKAEKGSFDILLKTLPWAFNFVRYGWLPKFIMVEWPLPG